MHLITCFCMKTNKLKQSTLINRKLKLRAIVICIAFLQYLIVLGQQPNIVTLDTQNCNGNLLILKAIYKPCEKLDSSHFFISSQNGWPEKGRLHWKIRFLSCTNEFYEKEFSCDVSLQSVSHDEDNIKLEDLTFKGTYLENIKSFFRYDPSERRWARPKASEAMKCNDSSILPNLFKIKEIPDFVEPNILIKFNFINGRLKGEDRYIWYSSPYNEYNGYYSSNNMLFAGSSNYAEIQPNKIKYKYLCVKISSQNNCNCKEIAVNTVFKYSQVNPSGYSKIQNEIREFTKNKVINSTEGSLKGNLYFTSLKLNNANFKVDSGSTDEMIMLKNHLNRITQSFTPGKIVVNGSNHFVNSTDSFALDMEWKSIEYFINHDSKVCNSEICQKMRRSNDLFPVGTYFVTEKKVTKNRRAFSEYIVNGKRNPSIIKEIIKSLFLPKGNNKLPLFIYGIGSISIISKQIYQNKYSDFKNSLNQTELDKNYKKANTANQIYQVTKWLSLLISSIDIIDTIQKSNENRKSIRSIDDKRFPFNETMDFNPIQNQIKNK
jgi:hypothetical protein